MWRFIFLPIAVVWAKLMQIRRSYYRRGRQTTVPVATIGVGNLCMGGSGKTPLIMYLYHLLEEQFSVATLSRGYGRKTKGNRIATPSDDALTIGDEPMMFHRNLDKAVVAVAQNRLTGVEDILHHAPNTDVVLLDDVYQHLALKPGLSILLTDYWRPYSKDYVFPVGTLREPRRAAKDADIIVVTKCPPMMSSWEYMQFLDRINREDHQSIYFSSIEFGTLQPLTQNAEMFPVSHMGGVLAVAGIANPDLFFGYLQYHFEEVKTLSYPDHHLFTEQNIMDWEQILLDMSCAPRAIVTTEKDAIRMMNKDIGNKINNLCVFYLPITMKFHESGGLSFNNQVLNYVSKHRQASRRND